LRLDGSAQWRVQPVVMEDGGLGPSHWLIAHASAPGLADEDRHDVVILGIEARFAESFALARGVSLRAQDATPIGMGCRSCRRKGCPGRTLRGPAQNTVE
jgi:predicted transcriptional regulator